MKRWRLLSDRKWVRPPPLNLAIEEAIPKIVGQGVIPNTLRLWRNVNTVVIGRFQCPKLETVFESCLKHKTTLSRRFTGGGAVYHDSGNLNFALSIRKKLCLAYGCSPSAFFKKVGLTIVEGLRNLEIAATFKNMNVYVADKKISGLAGKVTKISIFVHGSLLVNSDLCVLSQVLNFDGAKSREKFVRSVPEKVTTLCDELDRDLDMRHVERELVNAFESEFNSILVQGELTEAEFELAETLHKNKYRNPQWILSTCDGCPEAKIDAPILLRLAFHGKSGLK